jgi:hypothetical protein
MNYKIRNNKWDVLQAGGLAFARRKQNLNSGAVKNHTVSEVRNSWKIRR